MFTNVSTEFKNFDKIADILLNQTIIYADQNKYRICEIEFYYKGDGHEDTYTHCDDDQLEFKKFYFHKFKNGTYKAGTYKCVDITLGNKDKQIYFGVLIRSIYDIDNKVFIEGPCRSVNKFLEHFSFTTVTDFMKGKPDPLDIEDKTHKFYLEEDKTLTKERVYKGPRIGLSDKYPEFRNKDYRYATMINNIKKEKSKLK